MGLTPRSPVWTPGPLRCFTGVVVRIGAVTYLGKEPNRLDEVLHELVHGADEVREHFPDRDRDAWRTLVVPFLQGAAQRRAGARSGHECAAPSRPSETGHGRPQPNLARRLTSMAQGLSSQVPGWGGNPQGIRRNPVSYPVGNPVGNSVQNSGKSGRK